MINRWLLLVVLFPLLLVSQNIKGKVIDKVTREPVETASIYFDHTTIGTTTDENGEFSIEFNDAVQSNLVISFLGYEKVLITDYRSMSNVIVELVVATNTLDEVYVNFDDELTRAQKLQLFRKEFLGTSHVANSCKILNEEDLVLYYDSDNQIGTNTKTSTWTCWPNTRHNHKHHKYKVVLVSTLQQFPKQIIGKKKNNQHSQSKPPLG